MNQTLTLPSWSVQAHKRDEINTKLIQIQSSKNYRVIDARIGALKACVKFLGSKIL